MIVVAGTLKNGGGLAPTLRQRRPVPIRPVRVLLLWPGDVPKKSGLSPQGHLRPVWRDDVDWTLPTPVCPLWVRRLRRSTTPQHGASTTPLYRCKASSCMCAWRPNPWFPIDRGTCCSTAFSDARQREPTARESRLTGRHTHDTSAIAPEGNCSGPRCPRITERADSWIFGRHYRRC